MTKTQTTRHMSALSQEDSATPGATSVFTNILCAVDGTLTSTAAVEMAAWIHDGARWHASVIGDALGVTQREVYPAGTNRSCRVDARARHGRHSQQCQVTVGARQRGGHLDCSRACQRAVDCAENVCEDARRAWCGGVFL